MNTRWLLHMLAILVLAITGLLALPGLLDAAKPIASAAPPIQTTDATLRIINDSEQTICQVLISPVTVSEWGKDWLDEDETIPPGATASFDLPEGEYDTLLADCEGNVLLDERGITISGLYELHLTGPDLCKALNQEGMTLYSQAQYSEALREFQNALACYREAGNRAEEGENLHNIGFVHSHLGQYQEALDYYQQALDIAQEIGDRVIVAASEVFKKQLREGDIAARYGGDEFTLILPDTEANEAGKIGERIRVEIRELDLLRGGSIERATTSQGIACFPIHGEDAASLRAAADAALYEAKEQGRDLVVVAGK